jgi:hypothetical protein
MGSPPTPRPSRAYYRGASTRERGAANESDPGVEPSRSHRLVAPFLGALPARRSRSCRSGAAAEPIATPRAAAIAHTSGGPLVVELHRARLVSAKYGRALARMLPRRERSAIGWRVRRHVAVSTASATAAASRRRIHKWASRARRQRVCGETLTELWPFKGRPCRGSRVAIGTGQPAARRMCCQGRGLAVALVVIQAVPRCVWRTMLGMRSDRRVRSRGRVVLSPCARRCWSLLPALRRACRWCDRRRGPPPPPRAAA